MDEELEKLYLQNIEEYIFDEDKIVTYKWLSKTLNIHVNTAKQLLYTFATETESNRKPELQLTYLVGGFLHDGKGCRFQVVREDDLPKVKNQFKVVTSEHIYSIHKCGRLSDLNVLYGIEDGGTMQGPIQCKKSVRRLEEQLAELRLQSRAASLCGNGKLIPQVTKTTANKQKPKQEEPAQTKEKPSLFTTVGNKPKADKSSDPVESAPDTKKSKPAGSIASMFSAQSNKAKRTENTDQKKNAVATDAARETSSKAKGAPSITSMFANQASKSKPRPEEKRPEVQESPVPVEVDSKVDDSEKEVVVVEKPATKRKHEGTVDKTKASSKGKSKKTKKSDSKQPAKKRKRIMLAADSDSSDDDIFGKEDAEEEEEDCREVEPQPLESDPEDVIPSTPQPEPSGRGRKRRRKLVDRTFADDDGYIVTKKEFVFESCSGSEADEEEKENDKGLEPVVATKEPAAAPIKPEPSSKSAKSGSKKSSPKKKSSPPQKAKQMTLTSFFKKS